MRNIIQLDDTSVAGNANTDFTLSSYARYRILYGHVKLTTDATVADRRVTLNILDDTSPTPVEIFDIHSGAVVDASKTGYHHEFMQGIYRETSFIGTAGGEYSLQVPIPQDMYLDEGWTLRISVENGVAGDSYDVHFVAEGIGHRD